MKDLAENNVVRFKNLQRKKESIYANFKVNGVRKGVLFSASISVDIAALELSAEESLEKIIEECAKNGIKEFKNADFKFEGIESI
jgi:hypothetical protein